MTPIYLDNHATTRVDERVVAAMLPYFSEMYGNASSRQHEFGWKAEAAVERARAQVAALIGAQPQEIVFTSGATESINLALKGLAENAPPGRTHLVTVVTEHSAVLDSCDRLERAGFEVTRVKVDGWGLVDPDDIRRAITPRTFAVSVMTANNEIGTIAPVGAIGSLCSESGIAFHTDATQAAAAVPLHVGPMNIDLLSLSAHKFYGPKGVGALYVRSGIRPSPQIDGGGHERGFRSGTLNVPGIVGLGMAAELARREGAGDAKREQELRDDFVGRLSADLEGLTVNGHPDLRLPNNASITVEGVRADRLMLDVREVAMSTGSACSSSSPRPSHVLEAIGLGPAGLASTVRFGLGRFTTREEIEKAAECIIAFVRRARAGQMAVEIHPEQ